MARPRPAPSALRALVPALAVIASLAGGCSRHSTSETALAPSSPAGVVLAPLPAPEPSELTSFEFSHMPLAVGNRWDYRVLLAMRLVYADGSQETSVRSSILRSEITSEANLNEQHYYLQSEYDPRQGPPAGPLYAVRADATGLYHLDLFLLGPAYSASPRPDVPWVRQLEATALAAAAKSPHRAAFEAAARQLAARLQVAAFPTLTALPGFPGVPGLPAPGQETGFRHGSPRPGEITMLLYPMLRGSRWIVRDEPRFTRSVEGREQLSVPAGSYSTWVVRGSRELFQPNDRVHFWYAREGLVRYRAQGSVLAVDDAGLPVGRIHYETDQQLLSFSQVTYPL